MQFRVLIRVLLISVLTCSGMAQSDNKPTTMLVLAEGNNKFAFNLYNNLKGADGNLFYSPFSLRAALAMTYAGARNETTEEMASVLMFDLEERELHSTFATTSEDIEAGADSGYELKIANSLWGQRDLEWRKDFLSIMDTYYGVGLTEVDFKTNESAEAARKEINRWVEQYTNNKIINLIPDNILNPKVIPGTPPKIDYVRLVLVNAIYFKGDWQIQFPENETEDELFYMDGGVNLITPLMHRLGGGYRYAEAEGIQILELPYKGDQISMIVLLPKEKDGLRRVEGMVSAEKFNDWSSKLRTFEKVDVFLPKFKITWSTDMSSILKSLGMKSAFNPSADFSGMINYEKLPEPLFIGAVIHKAFVDVNEKGTEAAAATAVVMKSSVTESVEISQKIPVFRADHPFVFMIIDKVNRNVLFLGRIIKPK